QSDPGRRVAPKTKLNHAGMYAVLRHFIGDDRPVRQISRAEARRVQECLLKLPAHASKRFRGMTLTQVMERAQAEGLRPIGPATTNLPVGPLPAGLQGRARGGTLDKNVAAHFHAPDTPPTEKRRSFTSDDLARFFQGVLSPPGRPRRGLQWVPLLCLYHGLRL